METLEAPVERLFRALRREYDHAREHTNRRAISLVGCRYCGKHWVRTPGTNCDGHANCMVTPEFKTMLRDLTLRSPGVTYRRLSEVLGVTTFVLRAWIKAVTP